jgi:hypothetical protein
VKWQFEVAKVGIHGGIGGTIYCLERSQENRDVVLHYRPDPGVTLRGHRTPGIIHWGLHDVLQLR